MTGRKLSPATRIVAAFLGGNLSAILILPALLAGVSAFC